MKKIKIISITITTMLISLVGATLTSACQLEEGITVVINEWSGFVYPEIDIENQNITFLVNVTTNNNKTIYHVQDKLMIPLNITDNSGREFFIFPRGLAYKITMSRKIMDVLSEGLLKKYPGADSFLKRWIPVDDTWGVSVVKSLFGERKENISIGVDYHISNNTFTNGEQMTLNIYSMGFIAGQINGIHEDFPILGHKQVTLKIEYAAIES